MWLHRSSFTSLVLSCSGLLLAGTAPALSAQWTRPGGVSGPQGTLFEWNGRVDREVTITMRGREAWVEAAGRNETRLPRPIVTGVIPRQDGMVRVQLTDGRGEAQVMQQPSRDNDYTTVVRVRDRSGGADSYRVTAYWLDANGRNSDGRIGDRGDPRWGRDGSGAGQAVLHWSGSVDDVLEIRLQGNRITYRTLSGKGTKDVHAELLNYGIPRDNVALQVREREGRGAVTVVQQPDARNGYTAVIRVNDPEPRFGFYDFDVTMRDAYGGVRR